MTSKALLLHATRPSFYSLVMRQIYMKAKLGQQSVPFNLSIAQRPAKNDFAQNVQPLPWNDSVHNLDLILQAWVLSIPDTPIFIV